MMQSLQSLRFVFAVMIFMHHEGLFNAGGSCGVSFFMILSGFVMSVGYGDKVLSSSFNGKTFLLKRLIRLYPLHLLCLLVFLAICCFRTSAPHYVALIPNSLLVQSWIPVGSFYFSGNAVSWCLSDMLFFYIMFPLLIRWISKCGGKRLVFVSILAVLFYTTIMLVLPESYCHPLLYIFPLFRLFDFVIGMLLFKLYHATQVGGWENKILSLSYTQKTLLELSAMVLLVLALALHPYIPARYGYAAFWWLIIPEFLFVFIIFNNGGVISILLRNKMLLAIGKISFSFYMIHQLGLIILGVAFEKMGIQSIWQLPLSFMLILLSSYVIYHYYEIPISFYLKKRLK